MVYLFESELPENKTIFLALTKIYGINQSNSFLICKKLGFSQNFKIKYLTKEQINKLIQLIEFENYKLSSDLKKIKLKNNKRLVSIKSYRGLRKSQGLPIRGQRTHTNAKTARKRF